MNIIHKDMKGFRQFVKEDEDVAKTLAKLPKQHQEMVKGYQFLFEPGNTLKGDKGHVGMIVNMPKKIVRIAAPWNYGREFTLIHEIAHIVYEVYIRNTPLEKEWEKIALSVKDRKKDEPPEELFCHAYANHFAKNKIVIHNHPEWDHFIARVCADKKPVDKSMIP